LERVGLSEKAPENSRRDVKRFATKGNGRAKGGFFGKRRRDASRN